MPRDTLIQVRRGDLSEWQLANPTLADGELGFLKDTCELVIGDGLTDFSGLYASSGCIIGQSDGGGGGGTVNDTFKFINVSGQDLIVANGEDTLNFLAGHGIDISSSSGTNSITFAVSGLTSSDISDFNSALTGVILTDLKAGNNISFTYDAVDDDLYINAIDVVTIDNSGNVYIDGDLDVAGNLNVQGSSTIFNSTTVNIGDNIITLNIVDVVPSGGILVVRSGILPTGYATLLWQENRDRWELSSAVYSPNIYADTIHGFLDGRAACANNIFVTGLDTGHTNNGLLLTPVSDSGCQSVVVESSLSYDANEQVLYAPYFSGEFIGYTNNSYRVDVLETNVNNNYNVVLVDPVGSGAYLFSDISGIYYNPSTHLLHVPFISGANVGPENIGINSYVISNYRISNSKIDGGTP